MFATKNNLNAPPSDLCSAANCSLSTNAPALQASCVVRERLPQNVSGIESEHCSDYGQKVCVTLGSDRSVTEGNYANFTTGRSDACEHERAVIPSGKDQLCPAGDFAVIFGAWTTQTPTFVVHLVDCQLRYGDIMLYQNGTGPPWLTRESFALSTDPIHRNHSQIVTWKGNTTIIGVDQPWKWQAGYTDSDGLGSLQSPRNPYTFAYDASTKSKTGAVLFPKIYLRNSTNFHNDSLFVLDADGIARAIEKTFDMATLLAFVRAPHTGDVLMKTTYGDHIWMYDPRVCAILVIPVLATFIGGRYFFTLEDHEGYFIGYDPLEIARRASEILRTSETEDSGNEDPALSNMPSEHHSAYVKVEGEHADRW